MHRYVRRSFVLLIGLVALSAGVIAPASAHDEGKAHHAPLPEHATPVMQSFFAKEVKAQNLAAMGAATCPAGGGLAAGFPCSNIDLQAFMPLSELGGSSSEEANDIWGWTDPSTGKEYALIGMTFGTAFVDVTNASAPVLIGELPTHGAFGSSWRDIKTDGNHAFIVSEASRHGMQVFDLTELRSYQGSPITFGETAHYRDIGSAHNIVINEDSDYAYIVGATGRKGCDGGLHMVDISNPTNPRNAGCFSADGYTHDAQCVNYEGPDGTYNGREICLASNEDTLTIVDVTNKVNPTLISRTGYDGAQYTHQGWLTEDQTYFLLDDELDESRLGHGTLTRVVDVTDLDNPVFFADYEAPTAAIDHNQYVKGNHSYQSNYRAGLRILDISGIATGSLNEVAFFDVWPSDDAAGFNGAWSNYPYFESGNVIVSGIEQGLFIVRPNLGGGPGPDDPPSVSITSPADGATVSGSIELVADATDDNGVAQVEFFVDGISIDVDTDGVDGWSVNWNTTSALEGANSVTATATDTIGQTASDSISVTVDNVTDSNVHIGDLDIVATSTGNGGKWSATVTVLVHNDDEAAVSGATVEGTWNGSVGGSCSTGDDGTCSMTLSGLRKRDTSATFSVDMILAAGSTYTPGSNHDSDGDSTGTTISIPAP